MPAFFSRFRQKLQSRSGLDVETVLRRSVAASKDAAATEGCDSDSDEGVGHGGISSVRVIATRENEADEDSFGAIDDFGANSFVEDGGSGAGDGPAGQWVGPSTTYLTEATPVVSNVSARHRAY